MTVQSFTVNLVTKNRRGLCHPRPKMQWQVRVVTAQNIVEALEEVIAPFRENPDVKALAKVLYRDVSGAAGTMVAEHNMTHGEYLELENEFLNALGSAHADDIYQRDAYKKDAGLSR